MKKTVLLLVVLGVACFGLGAESVDEILARGFASGGGLDKIRALKSMTAEGKMHLAQMNLEMPLKMWQKSPNLMKMEISFQGMTVIQAYDGETAWWLMPPMGVTSPQPMPAEQSRDFAISAEFDSPFIDYQKKGYQVTLLGLEDFEGTPVYKLALDRGDERTWHFFLEQETCITLKIAVYFKSDGKETLAETILADYKEVDGLMVPFSIENRVNGQPMLSIMLDEIKLNLPIDNSLFSMNEQNP